MANRNLIGRTANTVHFPASNKLEVRYHNTLVVEADLVTGRVTLRTGGWDSVTTRTRMNQASNQFSLGYKVYHKDGISYVKHAGEVKPLQEHTVLEAVTYA